MKNSQTEPIRLELSRVTKVYPGAVALNDVSISITGGEVVGLIGENGAGKSTLMKVLGGTIAPDKGTIRIDGEVINGMSPARAARLGIAFVHQELNPFSNLDVAANVLLGSEIRKKPFGFIDRQAMEAKVRPILDLLQTRFGPSDPVAGLSLADQQLMEIARALSVNVRLIILDEPTSSLTLTETLTLLSVIERLRADGVAVLFITHRLAEIEQVADRVVCLRDGCNAGELERGAISKDVMVRMMVGRDINQFYDSVDHASKDVVLETIALRTGTYPEEPVDLQLRAGEILGLAGLVGAGRSELARTLFGVDQAVSGKIVVDGSVVNTGSVRAAIAAGICLVPENRKQEGLFLDFAIDENIALPSHERQSRSGFVNREYQEHLAKESREYLKIKSSSLKQAVAELSGGNQQKVVLAKWLAMNPKVIIFDEPTRGIDVGAKAEVYQLMQEMAGRGVAVLMISSDMEEVIGVSNRVAVMCRGRIAGILEQDNVTEENILHLAME